MSEQAVSTNFKGLNYGVQVGQSNGPIQASFYYPPEPLESTPPPFASIPFRRDPTFVERGDILDKIDRQCSEPASRVAIVGLGGVGKSQLAIEFAHRIAARKDETWVFWVHASTQARVLEGFKSIADKAKLMGRSRPDADILQLVFDWLSNERNGKWVLILDSVDDSDVLLHSITGSQGNDDKRKLLEYLPQSHNGSILTTTRNRELAFRLTDTFQTIHELGPMTPEEARLLLEKRVKRPDIPWDPNVVADLAKSLDYVPLAISQAAAYIQMRAPRTSLVQYLDEFRQSESKRVRLLSHDAGDLRRDLRQDGGASSAILTTWQVSFDHIRRRRQSAADLLSFMSFFNCQGIPESLIKLSTHSNNVAQPTEWEDPADSDSQVSGETENKFEDDVAILRDYCIIAFSEESSTFEMHGLVQLSMRRWLEAQGLQVKFLEQFITVLQGSFPSGDYENWTQCRALLPHVEAAVGYLPDGHSLQKLWSHLLYNGGLYALKQGSYAVAEQMVSLAGRTLEKLLGTDHESTLTSMTTLALIHAHQGRWKDAEKLYVRVKETFEAKLGVDHSGTLASMNNLALLYKDQGQFEEAEKLQEQVLEICKAKLGSDHPNTLVSMANLAWIYTDRGRLGEAEKLQMQVLEIRKVQLGVDHPDTLMIMHNLACTYHDQRRHEEAERLQVEVLKTRKVKLGVDHPNTLETMSNLASTYWIQGRWEESEKLHVQAMEAFKVKLGADHPTTLLSMGNLAFTWKGQGRHKEAQAMMESCVQKQRQVLGPNHPQTQDSLSTLNKWTTVTGH